VGSGKILWNESNSFMEKEKNTSVEGAMLEESGKCGKGMFFLEQFRKNFPRQCARVMYAREFRVIMEKKHSFIEKKTLTNILKYVKIW
jgi:hypothetical protein